MRRLVNFSRKVTASPSRRTYRFANSMIFTAIVRWQVQIPRARAWLTSASTFVIVSRLTLRHVRWMNRKIGSLLLRRFFRAIYYPLVSSLSVPGGETDWSVCTDKGGLFLFWLFCQINYATTSTDSIMISSRGTSSCPARRVVGTRSIASTTSIPSVTFQNTA